MKKSGTNFFAIGAVILGFSGIAGAFLGIGFLSSLGRAIAISPVPTPYTRVDKIPPFEVDRQLSFSCEELSGTPVWHRWDYHFRNTLPGPHRRTSSILVFFAMAQSVSRTAAIQQRLENMNFYYFCNGGPLAKMANCSDHVVATNFRWVDKDQGEDVSNLTRLPCLK